MPRHLLALVSALALAGCALPSASPLQRAAAASATVPLREGGQPPSTPQYPSWDEVDARQRAEAAIPQGDVTPAAPSPLANVPQTQTQGKAAGQPLVGGATLHETTVSLQGSSIPFQVVLFDDRRYALKVIDQPQDYAGGGQITSCMRHAGAAAGVNGGFFTPQFTPMGLMIADGHATGAWQANKLLTGAVVVGGGKTQLLWNAEARSRQKAVQFLQAGPRLVDGGSAVTDLEKAKHTTRTFIATDGGHRWLFGLARSTSLGELAEVLAGTEVLPGFRIQRALNLDGGRSSVLYYHTAAGQEHSDPGWSTVRNYLGIVPK